MRRTGRTVWVARALWELLRYDLLSAASGFGGVYRDLRGTPVARVRPGSHDETRVCDAVQIAGSLYWKPVRCLQRSVAAARLLRKLGAPAQLVIGYRPAPFFSHAWVEIDGRTVNDLPGYQKALLILERI
jgi:transglutaminase superfamily protein